MLGSTSTNWRARLACFTDGPLAHLLPLSSSLPATSGGWPQCSYRTTISAQMFEHVLRKFVPNFCSEQRFTRLTLLHIRFTGSALALYPLPPRPPRRPLPVGSFWRTGGLRPGAAHAAGDQTRGAVAPPFCPVSPRPGRLSWPANGCAARCGAATPPGYCPCDFCTSRQHRQPDPPFNLLLVYSLFLAITALHFFTECRGYLLKYAAHF